MRTLLLLRGAPGSGKSTWIRENNLEGYTLEADSFRQLISNPIMTVRFLNWLRDKDNAYIFETVRTNPIKD